MKTNQMINLVKEFPYALVEFKPTMGHIFQKILRHYEYWGYGDIDMILGRINKLASIEQVRRYDIVSVTFGDPYILYLRGQLVLHRNHEVVNNVWRYCEQFTNISARLESYHQQGRVKWPFQSAEGCYSYATIKNSNLSILISSIQISDAFNARVNLREAFLLGKAIIMCHQNPINIKQINSVKSFILESQYQGENVSSIYLDTQTFSPVKIRKYKCFYRYWFDKRYEVMS
jgi:hypothetical protein